MDWDFQLLKWRLISRRLDEVPYPEHHAQVFEAAEAAAMMASRTGFPRLLFPCLFDERSWTALERKRRSLELYW